MAQLSICHGETSSPLLNTTLGHVADENERRHGSRTHVYSPYQNHELTFSGLNSRSRLLAKSLLDVNLTHGDHIGLFLPNCYEHLEIFLAGGRIGLPVVSFNLTFTSEDLARAADFTNCKVVFICGAIGPRSLDQHIAKLLSLPKLTHLIELGPSVDVSSSGQVQRLGYETFITSPTRISNQDLSLAESRVRPTDILNIQFTSGTTGAPKAAQLTHYGMLNNGLISSYPLSVTSSDIILCAPPLFHCMGSIGSWLMAVVNSAAIIFPTPMFDAGAAVSCIQDYSVTVMHGVPTMFLALAEVARARSLAGRIKSLRTGFVAGSPVSAEVVALMADVLGMSAPIIGFGMTETSMATHGTRPTDPPAKQTSTVGLAFPHTSAKIVARDDLTHILPRGQRGELLISSYGLFPGYYRQPAATAATLVQDKDGRTWLRTGDEAAIDDEGYCIITGRIKDVIIRGGENIYPAEIEARLGQLPGVAEASVVGIPNERYGEVVGAFLRSSDGDDGQGRRPDDEQVREWVRQTLARQKAPAHVFWLGDRGLPAEFPKTGTGKHQKHILKEMAATLLGPAKPRAAKL